jgi:hypothetical protein
MMVTTGDRVKRDSSPKIYRVRKITNEWIVLEEEGGFSQVLAGRYNLGLSYRKVKQDGPGESTNFSMFGSYLG